MPNLDVLSPMAIRGPWEADTIIATLNFFGHTKMGTVEPTSRKVDPEPFGRYLLLRLKFYVNTFITELLFSILFILCSV